MFILLRNWCLKIGNSFVSPLHISDFSDSTDTIIESEGHREMNDVSGSVVNISIQNFWHHTFR